jgi:hypothetical protein
VSREVAPILIFCSGGLAIVVADSIWLNGKIDRYNENRICKMLTLNRVMKKEKEIPVTSTRM